MGNSVMMTSNVSFIISPYSLAVTGYFFLCFPVEHALLLYLAADATSLQLNFTVQFISS
jgi:hypothetical protein